MSRRIDPEFVDFDDGFDDGEKHYHNDEFSEYEGYEEERDVDLDDYVDDFE